MSESKRPQPSATVVLLRDASADLELLLLQRAPSRKEPHKPGPWVFPGGRIEPADIVGGDAHSEASARHAAIRETGEEAGLCIEDTRLETISRWITPEVSPRRFDTWFFVGVHQGEELVRPDGDEMVDHRWLSPRETLAAYECGELALAPPTFVTVTWLSAYLRAEHAVRELAGQELITFRPHICRDRAGELFMLYPGDAGYEAKDPDAVGARHRCQVVGRGFRYLRGAS
jgi:8-oxo-dGTP pyrophosphatase MutT (NUDIX family)